MGSCISQNSCTCCYRCIFSPSYSKILDNLYVGNFTCVEKIVKNKNKDSFTDNISFIKHNEKYKSKMTRMGISVYDKYNFADSEDQDIIKHFNKLKPLIEKILFEDNGKLLINCSAGASRSVSFCILTMMTFYNYTFEEAYELVDEQRLVKMNDRFYHQVKNYKPE